MNRILIIAAFTLTTILCKAQNFNGQWKGGFIDKSTSMYSWGGDRCDYVLDLDVNGDKVTGYSYTYFTDAGTKYYTICRLEGFIDKKNKYIEVSETARTKTNVPRNVSNSFQTHKLTWRKEGDKEILEGNWVPAPGQDRTNTGYGTTILSKRQLSEISPLAKKLNTNKDKTISPERPFAAATKPTVNKKAIPTKPITATTKTPINKIKPVEKKAVAKPLTKLPPILVKKDTVINPVLTKTTKPAETAVPVGFEKRNNNVLQTVNVENAIVKLELYDNGDVDGDSVTLFYNGNILLAHKKLTEQPITLDLAVNNEEVNELVMYADNLGVIPPNTALLIVTDGNKRYEVRITSDLKKSGTIRFVHKKKG